MNDIFSIEECLKELKKIYDETVEIQKTWGDKGTNITEIDLKFLKQREEAIKLMLKAHEEIKKEKVKLITKKDREEHLKILKERNNSVTDKMKELGYKSDKT